MEAIRAIVRAELEPYKLAGTFQYGITGVHGEPPDVTIDAEPSDGSLGLPALVKVPCQPSISGITSIPKTGINCTVEFLNRSPTQPVITGVDSLGLNPVARVGDQVTVFIPPLVPFVGVSPIIGTFAAFITILNPVTGTITTGSGKVDTG